MTTTIWTPIIHYYEGDLITGERGRKNPSVRVTLSEQSSETVYYHKPPSFNENGFVFWYSGILKKKYYEFFHISKETDI